MESALSERRKAFAAAHRRDEDRQAYISASRRASSVIAKAEAWQTTCSYLSPKSVHSLYRWLSTVFLPGNRLWSMPLTCDPTFPFLSQRPCVAESEATSLSSAEPRAVWSLTRPFALLSSNLSSLHCHWPRKSCLSHAKAPS